ncbi:TRAP transporter fused permease subunit [Desulfovibrio sp. OttesenSCG-928-C14]|nr:TRAP transporter fused permease subunit [Desulfovibrio sp. OttesenSCG-928-C14]
MPKFLKNSISVLAWGLFLYQMVVTQFLFQSYMQNQALHVGLVGALLAAVNLSKSEKPLGKAFWFGILASFVFTVSYIWLNIDDLELTIGFPEGLDMLVGCLLLVSILACTFQAWGKIFPSIAVLALAYMLFGHYLPEPLYHSPISFSSTISIISLGFGAGIFGRILAMMVDFGFLLVMFGSMLEIMGANVFFLEMGKLGGKVSKGGPAQTAVIGSAFVGMASGSALANVMITGAFTIPTMKRFGYSPEDAGAIEASASTGSQIMPPVMGATAFLMAAFLGVPFSQVMISAFVPAILYFLAIGINVELLARRNNISGVAGDVDMRMLVERAAVFIIPLAFLTVLLVMQKSPGFTAFWSILLILAIGFARKTTRPKLSEFSSGLVAGAISAAKISIVVATVAIIAQVVISTGLGTKLAHVVAMISQGNLLITLLLAMVLCIILGCGVPSSAAYALVAILIVPGIVQMGVNPFQIHFFCLYFAVISAITPPVALASLGASSIAGSNYAQTSWKALKLSFTGYLIPFFCVYNAGMLLRGDDPMLTATTIFAALMAILSFSFTIYAYFLTHASMPMRALSALSGLVFAAYVFTLSMPVLLAGCGLFIVYTLWQRLAVGRLRAPSPELV